MKLVKSLVLGSAAAFVGMTGAQAADLPGAEPVEYVKVCDAYGAGFFYIPGTDTCLLIGGLVRGDYSVGEVVRTIGGGSSKPANNTGFRARARLWFDARTETEYGTVRTYIRAQFQRDSGNQSGSTAATAVGGDDSVFDKAFVQFAGLTAGLTDSFWDFKPYPTFTNPFISDRTLAVLAYTADFGGGFSASIGIEDGTARRTTATGGAGGPGFADYREQKYPDIVGNLRVKQGWGEAQLSGFAHHITTEEISRDSDWGYGVQLGAKVDLPFLGKGDFLWASAAYSSGALSYLGLGSGSGDYAFVVSGTQNILNANRLVDFEVGPGGKIRKTEAYAFNLGVLHYWSPKWRSALQGTYVDANVKTFGQNNDFSGYGITTNIIWTPVKKLDIGAEINYVKVEDKSAVYNLRDDDAFVGRFRVQRDF
ncbi:porin [Methylopila turkensis]|uniref:Porin n=1 Tax=Methylopila turkensis TaxID=1437816 RepID=A0A9W6N864_9HYPH|nr:porin [Methylopila turkensis]GLK81117.1 polymerase [Methylopila turkensis]